MATRVCRPTVGSFPYGVSGRCALGHIETYSRGVSWRFAGGSPSPPQVNHAPSVRNAGQTKVVLFPYEAIVIATANLTCEACLPFLRSTHRMRKLQPKNLPQSLAPNVFPAPLLASMKYQPGVKVPWRSKGGMDGALAVENEVETVAIAPAGKKYVYTWSEGRVDVERRRAIGSRSRGGETT